MLTAELFTTAKIQKHLMSINRANLPHQEPKKKGIKLIFRRPNNGKDTSYKEMPAEMNQMKASPHDAV